MSPENLSDLLGRVSENSTGEINSLIGEFQRLREKLQTDRERIQHEIEEYEGTEPTGDAIYESHLRKRGESSSISGTSGKRVKGFWPSIRWLLALLWALRHTGQSGLQQTELYWL
jgi:hypothetical protein